MWWQKSESFVQCVILINSLKLARRHDTAGHSKFKITKLKIIDEWVLTMNNLRKAYNVTIVQWVMAGEFSEKRI